MSIFYGVNYDFYRYLDDIDLFSGGLLEKILVGVVIGFIFVCIIVM